MDTKIVDLMNLANESANVSFSLVQAKQIHDLMEKFAELIVKECVSLMDNEKEYYANPGSYESREYYERMQAKEDAFDDAAHIIKSHFGLK